MAPAVDEFERSAGQADRCRRSLPTVVAAGDPEAGGRRGGSDISSVARRQRRSRRPSRSRRRSGPSALPRRSRQTLVRRATPDRPATPSAPSGPGRQPGASLRSVAGVAMRRLIAPRGPTWAPTGEPRRFPDRRPGQFAKLGRVHTVARRGPRRDRVARMGYPAPVGRRTLRRVARAAQHGGVSDVERRTASGERGDVIDGQVGGGVGGTLVARTPVAVLAAPGTKDAGAEALPGPRAVQGVVPAAVGLLGRAPCSGYQARLVTTPQTVHSFTRELSTAWLARSIRSWCYARRAISGLASRGNALTQIGL